MNLERAIEIAVSAHKGQVDKAGAPYVLHPLRMMLKCEAEDERIAAVLHDVIEDTPWTLDDLREEGFAEEVLEAVDCLTARPGEDYLADFIPRCKTNLIARQVKLRDLEDNSDLGRISLPTEKDYARIRKYEQAVAMLRTLHE